MEFIAATVLRLNLFKFIDPNPSVSTWGIAERIERYHCTHVSEMEVPAAAAKDTLELIWRN